MAASKTPESQRDGKHGDGRKSREVRDLEQQGKTALTWGLPNPAKESAVVGAALLMREKLAEKHAGAAAAAVAIAADLIDKTMPKLEAASQLACHKGCSWCCHSVVSVSAPEVFRITDAVRAGAGGGVAAVEQRIATRKGRSLDQMLAKSMPCPLLVDGDCSVHADRPLGCRQYASTSAEACQAHQEGRRADPPFVPAAANVGLIARSALHAAASSLGQRGDSYELASALGVALADPEAERRWLDGNDSLSAAIRIPQSPNMRGSIDRWSPMLKGLVEE